MQDFYRINVPRLGFSHPFVLHALMAFSARHLAQFRASKRTYYIAKADHHWEIGLRSASALVPAVDDANAPALYIFAIFSCFYTLAKGPKPRDFLVFSDEGLAEWLILLRGVRAIMETTGDSIRHSALSPLFTTASARVQKFYAHDPASGDEHPRVAELRELVADVAGDSPNLPTYLAAIDDVSRCFACVFDDSSSSASSQTVFIWMYRVSDDFVLCLQQRQPVALTVFAYFVVLLNELGNSWWMQGWVYHLLAGIHDALDEGSKSWIRWPMERLGWIPDL
ncbi:c6 zinc finger protein [Diplodia corticola]|uniref:C6 zinc finger protein n=1 Tax=Diplodia corticola TaxID=236234 RepID=A0A1J9R060_9PEZI|nr:c6 zinc finger protein [Diplodia corticola]OJD34016.1 c6 zinc finger protein [Diplodia corticola]